MRPYNKKADDDVFNVGAFQNSHSFMHVPALPEDGDMEFDYPYSDKDNEVMEEKQIDSP